MAYSPYRRIAPYPYNNIRRRSPLEVRVKPDSVILENLKTLTTTSVAVSSDSPAASELPPGSSGSIDGMAIAGRLTFFNGDNMIDCKVMDERWNGISVPQPDQIRDMKSDALFILLVQDDDVFGELSSYGFYDRIPCIIVKVTKTSQLDSAVRVFFSKMKMELNVPVLAILDCDPLSIINANLITPDFKWLGIRPSDLDKYEIKDRVDMSKRDTKIAKDLMKMEFVKKNAEWVQELNLMMEMKQKVKVEALRVNGYDGYLRRVYLPLKLQEKDWL